jgi:hypothetical protein
MQIDLKLKPADLSSSLARLFELAANKIHALDRSWDASIGTPVFTVAGQYTSRGWTEWTQGFQYGSALLAFDATDDRSLLELGRRRTVERMAHHVTHIGVHDHGFNNISTYGNLRRLTRNGRIAANEWEMQFYELALKASGAVQAARWQGIAVPTPSELSANAKQLGYIYSFNGPQSLFIDTMRTLRSLSVAWQLGQPLMHENDRNANLLKRAMLHALATNQFLIFHGSSEHTYDIRGRTAHEALFNRNDGAFRARSTQQGYSPFSTWTRGLAWAILGYAEQLEFIAPIADDVFEKAVGLKKAHVSAILLSAARDTADHYIDDCATADGVVYWDDGAPGLARLGDWKSRAADPFNDHEPVDASASAVAAQGLVRLGRVLGSAGGTRYAQAGFSVAKTLLADPYVATSQAHQGLLLHSIYHRPNNWDYIPPGRKVPCGESSLWGDYHLLELALLIHRLADDRYYAFFE